MTYRRFATFNVVGAFAWVLIFVVLGHFFGNLPAVRKNFQ
jgi:membrane-associated protein